MRKVLFFLFAFWATGDLRAEPVPESSESGTPRVLPPFLNRLASGLGRAPTGINVTGQDQRKRRALVGEWLDYGDFFQMRPSEAATVIQHESLTWVSGGVFEGRVTKSEAGERVVYAVELRRGWIRVWIRPSAEDLRIEVRANGEVFSARDAEFWIGSRQGRSELYLVRGEVMTQRTGQQFQGKVFVALPEGGAPYPSTDWDPGAIDVHIAKVFPELVRLASEVDLDWKQGRIAARYAGLRKKGWKRYHRLAPDIRK